MSLRDAVGRRPYRFAFVCASSGVRATLAAASLNALGGRRFSAAPFALTPAPLAPEAAALCARFALTPAAAAEWPPGDLARFDLIFALCLPEAERHDMLAAGVLAPSDSATICWPTADPFAPASAPPGPGIPARPGAALLADVHARLHNRVQTLVNLPFDRLDRLIRGVPAPSIR